MIKRLSRTLLLAMGLVLVCTAIAYAATFYATMEWPFYISGYSTLTANSTSASASTETLVQAYQIWFDPMRAHCQLWEDGHLMDSDDNSISTYGQYAEIFAYCSASSKYDGNWWVYGIHQAYDGYLDWNEITSDGYVSAKSGDVNLQAWNELSMSIAESCSGKDAILIPWYELATAKTLLGKDVGCGLVARIIDTVVPQLQKGDLMPAVSVDKVAGVATVFVPHEKGGCSTIKLEFPKADNATTLTE